MKYILFDCMETLVDLKILPNLRDYASWGFDGSGVEELWKGFDEFFQYYLLARSDIAARLHENQEYEMHERLFHLVSLSFPDFSVERLEAVARKLSDNYWKNYKAVCYIREDVMDVLPRLAEKYRLGVVSNFMVRGGIEELLEKNGASRYFDCVVTSIAEGWRKPHPAIYRTALECLGAAVSETAFVGDDYVNDFTTPAALGMKPFFLDRYGRRPEVKDRVEDFYELERLLV